jgi:hypothetical protein
MHVKGRWASLRYRTYCGRIGVAVEDLWFQLIRFGRRLGSRHALQRDERIAGVHLGGRGIDGSHLGLVRQFPLVIRAKPGHHLGNVLI